MNLRKPVITDSRTDAGIIIAIFVLAVLSTVAMSFEPRSSFFVGLLFFWSALGPVINLILSFLLVESYLRKDYAVRRHGGWVIAALVVAWVPLIASFLFVG